MINFSQLIAERKDAIMVQWMDEVRQDRQLKSDDTLSPVAIRDHLPLVLDSMATVLRRDQDDDLQCLVDASFQHGVLRAQQGFDPVEITREYRLLRRVIFATLEAELMSESAVEVYRVFRLIDMVVDEAIAQCFKSYVGERMKELDQLRYQLAMTGQEMDRLVRANQDNMSSLTDELRVRLNTITGFSELLLRQQQKQATDVRDTAPRLEHIERILHNGRQLLHLINDATELSRYEAGKLKLHPIATNVGAIVQEIVQVAEPAIAANVEVIVNCDSAPAHVLTDPLRLHQIISNLLNNAIQYTESGSIQLQCQTLQDERWSVTVRDTGIGIAPEALPRIFDLYFQVESNERSRAFKSNGLGLAIVSRLVNLLQGEIQVASELGAGSTFTASFPMAIVLPDEDASP